MSHTSADNLNAICKALAERYGELVYTLRAREPRDAFDGAGRGKWNTPEKTRILLSTAMERRLAVAAFKAILAEINAIK